MSVIHARLELTGKAGAADSLTKFQEMFLRRAEKGQCFHRPYLGCREFAADFALIRLNDSLPEPVPESMELGWMLYDILHDSRQDKDHVHSCTEACRPSFFRATLKNGTLHVPPADSEEVRQ